MRTRLYLLGILIVLSAFMTAFVLTAQEDGTPAKEPAKAAPPAAVPAPAKADEPAAKAPGAAETAVAVPTPGLPAVPVVAAPPVAVAASTSTVQTIEGEAGFADVTSGKGEVKGAKATASQTGDRLNITFDDVEMVDVVRMFTKIANINILSNPTNLRGRVTANLTDVEWRPALENILGMHSLMLQETPAGSGVYSILPKAAGVEPLRVETYFLKYATVAEVQGLLTPMIGQGGTISPFPSRNALVIRANAAAQGEVKNVILKVDKLRDQVFIEAKFLELNDEAIRNLGVNWQVLQAYKVGVSRMNLGYNENRAWRNTRSDTMNQWDRRNNLDQANTRSDINGQPYEESTTSYTDLNADGDFSDPGETVTKVTPTRTITDTIDRGKSVDQQIAETFDKTITDVRTAVLSADDFGLVLSALKTMNGISIVSNPKIIVANEQPAVIHIGTTERPFVSTVTPATTTTAPIVTYNPGAPLDIGVKLTVTPTVNTESNITVKIEPELTRRLRNDVAPNGQTYPVVSSKKITTIFCLENGRTVAIGGLTETEDRDTETKVPLLGDIPIIGKYLFTHSQKVKSQTETIIFVTVGLAQPETIERETGLPEQTQLAHQQMLSAELERARFKADMDDLKKAAEEKKERGATVPSRLLKRRL